MLKILFPPKAAELEVRKGIKNGEYSVAKVKVSSLRKKDVPELLLVLNEVAHQVEG